jgi:excisionase family DNA binding protein
MPIREDLLSIAEAAEELGLTRPAIRRAIMRGLIEPVRLDGRTNLIPRSAVDRYKAEHLGNRGGRKRPDDELTEQQRKQRAYQRAYYQRRKAARQQQPATQPAE